MCLAIKSLYNGVKCSVRINSFNTDWFSVNCGLKQGSPLLPLLFKIFINDLTVYLKSFDLGIDIGGEKACIQMTLYCWLTLQKLLDRLCTTWCNNNNITINACKSSGVQFRLPSMEHSKYMFKCSDMNIDLKNDYTYLGLILNKIS